MCGSAGLRRSHASSLFYRRQLSKYGKLTSMKSAATEWPPAWFGVLFSLGVAALVIAQLIHNRRCK